MPLEIETRPLDSGQLDALSAVLRDMPEARHSLEAAIGQPESRLWVGIFNARPVSLALVIDGHLALLVVHPATRGRGVGADTLRLAGQQQSFTCPAGLARLAAKAGLKVQEEPAE